jgi:replicative DNA helicase
MDDLGPIPFVDEDLETTVVGAALLDPTAIALIEAAGVTEETFGTPRLALVWEVIKDLFRARDVVDAPAVAAELKRRGKYEAAGGIGAVHALTDVIPTIAHAERHARELVDLAIARRCARECALLAGKAHTAISPREYRAAVVTGVRAATEGASRTRAMRMSAAVRAWWAKHDSSKEAVQHPARFGIAPLDKAIGQGLGLEPGWLVILAARPAMGKSALAGQAVIATARAGVPVMVFSLEMSTHELTGRWISGLAQVDANEIARKHLSQADYDAMSAASEMLHELPVVVDDTPKLPFVEIRARALAEHAREKLGLVVIDHLQIVGRDPSAPRGEREDQHLGAITGGAKALAKELECPVILLSQLNRECEHRDDKRPVISDLRGSGNTEQDADVVMFIYRDEVYDKHTKDKGIAEVALPKARSGYNHVVRLRFRRELTLFDDALEGAVVGADAENDNDQYSEAMS